MFIFENEFAGRTVLSVLTVELGFSRKAITALKKKDDGLMINGSRVTVRAVIGENDIFTVNDDDVESEENENIVPNGAMPEILFEDECLIVVNKPAGMPTHPSIGHFDDTLANALALYYKEQDRPFVFRSINRLDRNTSGTVLVAKDRLSAYKLGKSMKNGEIHKTYLALLSSIPENECGVIERYIRRREQSIIFREVCEKDAQGAMFAKTEYKILLKGGNTALAEVMPITGRTHQIRVHFASLGCPLLGDDLYGDSSELIGRHALHARAIGFPHPKTNRQITISAPLPCDMQKIIDEMEKGNA